MNLVKFYPLLKQVVWGGSRLAALRNIPDAPSCLGESWEISAVPGSETRVATPAEYAGLTVSELTRRLGPALVGSRVWEQYGDRFPLLVKFIDAARNLSVQVHPDDEMARRLHGSSGKNEMWYVLQADPGAHIICGLSRRITPADYERLVAAGRILDVVATHPSHPGDVYYVPAGRLHSIGAGNLLVEVQQTSDITYRVYDYGRVDAQGRPRQLHTELARDAIDYNVYPAYLTDYDRSAPCADLVACPSFRVRRLSPTGSMALPLAKGSFTLLVCLEGECGVSIDGGAPDTLPALHTGLVAAEARSVTLTGPATLLAVDC